MELDPEGAPLAAASVEAPIPAGESQAPSPPAKPPIVVLPFVNLSQDPEQEYFSEGMPEDLITDLSKLAGLFVISRSSVFVYKDKAADPADVSRELGVCYLLGGCVRKADRRVRIRAQQIDSTSDYFPWEVCYDREFQDIFELSDEVTHKSVSASEVKLIEGE